MFSSTSSSKKIKIEANPRLVEGQQDEFEVQATNGSKLTSLNNPQSHITYKLISPVSQSPGSSTTVVGASSAHPGNNASNVHVLTAPASGQFYVIGNPSEVTTASGVSAGRVLAPKTTLTIATTTTAAAAPTHSALGAVSDPPGSAGGITNNSRRIDRRRATHNEVERRRRDTINAWIMQLGKLIPDLDMDDQDKSGPPKGGALSKGGILAKACDFVTEITEDNKTLLKRVKELEHVADDHERLLTTIEDLREENSLLKQRLENHGIAAPSMDDILGS